MDLPRADIGRIHLSGCRPYLSLLAQVLRPDDEGISGVKHLWRRLSSKWGQYQTETAIFVSGFLGLLVNLACVSRLQVTGVIVLVDNRQEAAVLRFFRLVAMIPRCQVHVIQQSSELCKLVENIASGELLVATSRVCVKYYQVIAVLRRRVRLIVL